MLLQLEEGTAPASGAISELAKRSGSIHVSPWKELKQASVKSQPVTLLPIKMPWQETLAEVLQPKTKPSY
jgi:hypothetical protein